MTGKPLKLPAPALVTLPDIQDITGFFAGPAHGAFDEGSTGPDDIARITIVRRNGSVISDVPFPVDRMHAGRGLVAVPLRPGPELVGNEDRIVFTIVEVGEMPGAARCRGRIAREGRGTKLIPVRTSRRSRKPASREQRNRGCRQQRNNRHEPEPHRFPPHPKQWNLNLRTERLIRPARPEKRQIKTASNDRLEEEWWARLGLNQ